MSRKDQLNALFGLKPGQPKPDDIDAPGSGKPAPEIKAGRSPVPSPPLGAPNASAGSVVADPAGRARDTAKDQAKQDDSAKPASGVSPRVRSGAVGAMSASLRGITENAREADALRSLLAAGEQVLALDPALIDAAPVADRLAFVDDPSFVALKDSIAASGQQVPALVRPHPVSAGRYQAAYGHRRIRACAELGLTVKALVRPLSDVDLAIAQGQENLARRDLSFIEKAFFALGLETSGLPRAAILQALATDKGDLSRYLSVARSLPIELARAIGPAPKAGRARWLALSEALAASGWRPASASSRASSLPDPLAALLEKHIFAKADSDGRFALVLAVLKAPAADGQSHARLPDAPLQVTDAQGRPLAALSRTQGRAVLTFAGDATSDTAGDARTGADFALFLAERLPELHRRWLEAGGTPET